jgi:hypothetical protein
MVDNVAYIPPNLRSRVIEKTIVSQIVKKLPGYYETRRFIPVFTTAHHWTLS